MKVCFKCLVEKDLEDFYKHPGMADGHLGKCKECARRDSRKNRRDNLEHYRSYDRARGSRQSIEDIRRYRKDNPIKVRAHRITVRELRAGRLVKPDRCSVCYAQGPIHGHHDDYSKPLEVRWLCVSCHKQWHSLHGEGLNAHEETHG